jgi:hypothetical protein
MAAAESSAATGLVPTEIGIVQCVLILGYDYNGALFESPSEVTTLTFPAAA